MSRGVVSVCADAELSEVVDLVNAAYRGEGGQSGWTSEIGLVDGRRVTVDALRRELAEAPDLCIHLLRKPPELLACVRCQNGRDRNGEATCHISMLAVRPGLQAGGLGRQMLEYAEMQGRARGARLARMTVVSVRTGLIAWYLRRGYLLTGETEPFPYADARFGVPQRSGLEFVVLQKELT